MNVYITDGTEECFYTAVFNACTDRDCVVTSSHTVQLSLGASVTAVRTDRQKCERVRNKLTEYAPHSLRDVSVILRRGSSDKEQVALEYIRLIVQKKSPVGGMLSHPAVIAAREEMKKVTLEAHRFKGFLRFMEAQGGIYYAPFAPDNDILEMILPHFIARLKNQPFIIHDTLRGKAALYNTKECVIAATGEKVDIPLSECETHFQTLWKEYYTAVNIADRPHEKQMKNYMPVRYWKFMPEKRG